MQNYPRYRRSAKHAVALALATLAIAGCASRDGNPAATSPQIETLVSGGPLHGAKGITFGPDGHLYVCSVYAETIYRVDITTGEVTVAVGPPHGESDDVAFAPDGTMAWTALPSAELRAIDPGGDAYVLAANLPLINPLRYTRDGRLYASQIGIDRFLEIDTTGAEAPRVVTKGIGHLNSFTITADDQLYGPLAGINKVAHIDLDSGNVTHLTEDLGMLSAVDMGPDGNLYAVGWASGKLLRIDPGSGESELLTTIEPPLDNLAVAADGMVYVSQPAKSRIIKIQPADGSQSIVVPGNLGMPGGLATTMHAGRETLIVADDFGFRHVDIKSGEIFATIDLSEFLRPAAANDVAANDDVILLSDVTRSRVYRIDRNTNETTHQWTQLGTPYGLVITASGEPVYADYESGNLVQLSISDRKARTIVASGLEGPVDIVQATPSTYIVSEADAGRITRVDIANGNKTRIVEGLKQPEGMTVLPNGHLAVVEVGMQRLLDIDPELRIVTTIANELPVGAIAPEAPAPVYIPSGVAAGKNGDLFVTSDINHSVLRVRSAAATE